MKKICEILILTLVAVAAFAQKPDSSDSISKKAAVVRDQSTGAITVGEPETSLRSAPSSAKNSTKDSDFDLGGFLKELFEAGESTPKKSQRSYDCSSDEAETRTAPAPSAKSRISSESSSAIPTSKGKSYDTFEDNNNNGIDDRLEGVKTIKASRSKN
ncbi:hypothetical protein KAH81_03700 [bacterium]|nr:hypothetical protein [bacterium]